MRMILMTAAVLLAFPAMAAKPPVAKKVPYEVKTPFGAVRNDDYYWLRDDTRKNEEMLAYLRAENAYADTVLAASKPLAQTLYKEVTARLVPDDSSVPYLKGGYWYYTRYVAGKDYAVVARRKGEMTAPEEILLDQNAMAEGKGYFRVGAWVVSPDKTKIAWSEDTVGRGQYGLRVKTIATGEILDAAVSNIEDIVWSDDNTTIYYIDKDPVTLLSKRVKAHVIGTEAAADRLVYEEADDSYYISLGRTTSDKYVCIYLHATVSDEQRCAPAGGGDFAVIAPRERDFLYTADHVEGPPHLPGMLYRTSHISGRWIIRTNWQAKNYRLMQMTDSSALGNRTK